MQWFYFFLCALLFSLGDYLCALEHPSWSKLSTTVVGALVGVTGYVLFAILSRTTPLYALAGFINGAVVIITCVGFGYFVQGSSIRYSEWLWLSVIFSGIVGLAYARST